MKIKDLMQLLEGFDPEIELTDKTSHPVRDCKIVAIRTYNDKHELITAYQLLFNTSWEEVGRTVEAMPPEKPKA